MKNEFKTYLERERRKNEGRPIDEDWPFFGRLDLIHVYNIAENEETKKKALDFLNSTRNDIKRFDS